MISKQFILFSILCSSLFAKVEVNLELNKNDSIYKLESNDIVFKDDKLKFSMKSDKNEVLEIFYKTNKNKLKFLEKIELKKDITQSYPQADKYVILDDETGTLTFLFKTNSSQKEFILNTNPKLATLIENEENIKKDKRIYIDKSKIISNDRGEKEANIIIPKLEASTVIINNKSDNSIGAGVIINDGKNILTNYHVVEADKENVYIAFKPKLGNKPSNNNYYKVKVVKVDMTRDLALLEMPKDLIERNEYISLKLADIESLKKGIDIYNMGHPLGYYFAFEYGMLTNILNDYSWDEYKANYILQYSMNANKGNSGSPIVNDKLELIGIGAFSNKKGENLNFGISVIDIKNFIDSKDSVIVKKKNADEYKNKIIEQGLYKNIKLAKIDRNKNGIPDAMMKDIDNDGIWDIIAYDTDEDGSYERVTSFR
ncbi:serine protease [Aliarcobacter cryaerophilus]|uniref:S1 family peptidase n=1 Tax=Aliarcobacter cryaerophilus TaxID=28198 RepID=UPI0021B6D870|nr:serine protease [Aliarcobacter cryaerophilus]MCT7540325.1 serine protease [Aliarcobacter cryaerophilus]